MICFLYCIIWQVSYTISFEPAAKANTGTVDGVLDGTEVLGKEILVKVLRSHGVDKLFCLPGSDNYPLLDEANKQGIRVINFRNEVTAVYAAQTVGRLTGRPGVVTVTSGPGQTNTITAAVNALQDEVPVIILGGDIALSEVGTLAIHEMDSIGIMTPACKEVFSIESVADIIPIMKKAFQVSMSGTPGPVYVQVRKNTQEEQPYLSDIDKDLNAHNPQCSDPGSAGLFEDDDLGNKDFVSHSTEDALLTPLPVTYPIPRHCDVQASAKLIASAVSPLIIVGTQAMLVPRRVEKLSTALKSMGVPIHCDKSAKGCIGQHHELLVHFGVADLLRAADVIILAGVPCDVWFRFCLDLPKTAKIVTVGRNTKTLTLNSPKVWTPVQVSNSDPGQYLIELANALKSNSYQPNQEWIQTAKKISDDAEHVLRKISEQPSKGHLNPYKVLFSLDDLAPENAIFVHESGDFAWMSESIIRGRHPLSSLSARKFGNCGIGLGVAMGAKLARPDLPVYLLTGDGSIGFTLADFDSCVRHNIPVVVWVGNDGAWGTPKRDELEDVGSSIGTELTRTNYHLVVSAMGGNGILLDKRNQSTFDTDVGQIIEGAEGSFIPTLVNIQVEPTNSSFLI